MRIMLLATLSLAITLNIFLYVYRKKVLAKQHNGKYFLAGIYLRRVIARKGIYIFDLSFFNAIWTFVLGCLSGAALFILSFEAVVTDPLFLSEPTALANYISTFNFNENIFITFVILLLVPAIWNIFYLSFKIAPLFSRFALEFKGDSLSFVKRFGRKSLAKIDFKKPYIYEETIDYWGFPPPFKTPVTVHIFAQNGKAIAVTKNLGEMRDDSSTIKELELVYSAKVLEKVDTIYQVVIEDHFEEEFAKLIKKWRKDA